MPHYDPDYGYILRGRNRPRYARVRMVLVCRLC